MNSELKKKIGEAKYKTLHPLYEIWRGMRQRCRNKNHHSYKYYGAKGIDVCKRWEVFDNFVDDIGPRPSKDHSVDRINVSKGYTPSNCRWSTIKEQSVNKNPRKLKSHCPHGHKMTQENVITVKTKTRSFRTCRKCRNIYGLAYWHKNRKNNRPSRSKAAIALRANYRKVMSEGE